MIDNKNWGESMLNNPGFSNLNQAKEMINTGKGKYFFRARENVNMKLIKEKFADFLKKPKGHTVIWIRLPITQKVILIKYLGKRLN